MSAEGRRAQLLSVTAEIVSEGSFHDVSLEAVARRAGVTRALIYQHFDDVQALLEAVVAGEMQRALEQVAQTTLSDLEHGDPRELMLASLSAFLDAVREHPTTWRLVLMPPVGAPESMRRSIERGRNTVLERMARAVGPLLAAVREPGDAEITAHILSAVSDEYARLVLTDPARHSPERLLRHARWWLEGLSL